MLEGKDYTSVDTIFPFVAALLDRIASSGENLALVTVHTLYSDTVNYLL